VWVAVSVWVHQGHGLADQQLLPNHLLLAASARLHVEDEVGAGGCHDLVLQVDGKMDADHG
jgi:hypothetical protein